MKAVGGKLGATSTGFALAAAIAVLFNTALACAKDAYKPLNSLMNSIAWHNWITQGLANAAVFVILGLLFSKTTAAEISANRLINFLVWAVIVAGIGLFGWYALY